MKIAVQGCGHGNLNAIYQALAALEARTGDKADLLLVCGDFQALRHSADLDTLACPPKYRHLGDFSDYWAGRRVAPVLTIFIGGNHEGGRHLWELYYGGWVAPRMYYLGHSGCVRVGGLRIAGISGIYNPAHYQLGYHEYHNKRSNDLLSEADIRSSYHTRQLEYAKLSLLKFSDKQRDQPSVFISHEWPHDIYRKGNMAQLLRCKPFFKKDIEHGEGIGSKPLRRLFDKLKPNKWFAAHMHVEFEAKVVHGDGKEGGKMTEFLALDKCLPRRRHLRIIDIPEAKAPANDPMEIEYDDEWLAIIRAAHPFLSVERRNITLPKELLEGSIDLDPHKAFVRELKERLSKDGRLLVPRNYEAKPADRPGRRTTIRQTAELCKMLNLTNDIWVEDKAAADGSLPVKRDDLEIDEPNESSKRPLLSENN